MKNNPDLTPSKTDDPTDKLLTIAEVAEECRCSHRKVQQWIAEGRLSYLSLGDGAKYMSMIRVRESALIKFWRKNERKAIP